MQNLKSIVVVDNDEISSFISQQVLSALHLAYHISYLSNVHEGLDYLKQTYPKGATVNEAESLDLVLLGMTLKHFKFLDDIEDCKEVDSSRLCFILLTPMFTDREIKKISKYKSIHACIPKMLSEPVIREALDSYLALVKKNQVEAKSRTKGKKIEKYYELILELLELHNQDELSKKVIDILSPEDIQAARKWTYQKQKNRDNPDFKVILKADQIENDFDWDEWEWSDN